MLQDTATAETKYKLFIEKVAATKLVWGLLSKQGWANSSADSDDETDVIPFWSERGFAKACARDDWRGFTATEIPLADFLENWCIGMDENDTLVGANWDANMIGQEVEPLQVVFDILNRLKAINSTIKFKEYNNVEDFLTAINESN